MAAFDPTTTTSAALVSRLQASALALANGAQVATWTDPISGYNATQATSARKPTYRTSGLYLPGPVVAFNGSLNQYLGVAHAFPSAYTIFIVHACDWTGGYGWQALQSQSSQYNWAVGAGNVARPAFWQGGSGTIYGLGPNTNLPIPLICGVGSDGTSTQVWYQGANVTGTGGATSGTGVSVAPGALYVGGASKGFSGEVAEILIYNGLLNSTDFANVIQGYLAYTYMPVTGVSVAPGATNGASGAPVSLTLGWLPALTGVYLTGGVTPALADDLGTGTFGAVAAAGAGYAPATQAVNYTPASAGLRAVTETAAGLASGAANYLSTTTGAAQAVAYNNAAVYYPPGGWDDYGTYKSTNAPGNYFKTCFGGTSFAVNLSVSALVAASVAAASYPVVDYRIDGGAWTRTQLTSSTTSITCATGLAATNAQHLVEFVFGGTDTTVARWAAAADSGSPVNSLRVTGFAVDAGQTVFYPTAYIRPNFAIVYADSIGEGYNNVSPFTGGALSQDAAYAWPSLIADALQCEYWVQAFASQGYGNNGAGGVPAVPNAWNLYSAGRSRLSAGLFPQSPTYVICGHGSNSNPSADPAACYAQLASWRTACGAATVLAQLQTYGPQPTLGASYVAYDEPYLQTAVTAYQAANPSDKCLFVAGPTQLLGDGGAGTLHYPAAFGHTRYAAGCAAAIRQAVAGVPAPAAVLGVIGG